jgi:uncharacterized membrane protein YkvA (DUF1232 family)
MITTLAGAAAGLLALWGVMLLALWRGSRGREVSLREALRLIPDVVGLMRRLAVSSDVPRGVRVRIWLLLGYLVCPIDLVPDFIPVLGYLDDAVITVIAVRSIARRAGVDTLIWYWPGTDQGLDALLRLTTVG